MREGGGGTLLILLRGALARVWLVVELAFRNVSTPPVIWGGLVIEIGRRVVVCDQAGEIVSA